MVHTPLRRLLRHGLEELQHHLRPDHRLRSGGLVRARDGYAVWLECEGPDTRVWRCKGRLPRGATPRSLQLGLADALADLAAHTGAGVTLWKV